MIVSINSSLLSGLFGVLELLLTLTLIFLISRLVRFYNLYTLYHLRRPFQAHCTRLSILATSPVTSPFLSRLCTFVLLLCIILLTTTSFSITGQSETVFQTRKVTLLTSEDKGDILDVRRHISTNGSLASATFLFLSDIPCAMRNNGKVIVFKSFINILGDINEVKWPVMSTILPNYTCLSSGSAFRPQKFSESWEQDGTVAALSVECNLNVDFEQIPTRLTGATNISPLRVSLSPNCKGRPYAMHCSTQNQGACVLSLNMSSFFTLTAVTGTSTLKLADFFPSMNPHLPQILSSTAYILDVGFTASLQRAHEIARTRLIQNGDVEMAVGERRFTRVNFGLFLGTILPLLFMYVCVIAITCSGWWKVGRSRQNYNSFAGVEDAKACLWNEMKRKRNSNNVGKVYRFNGEVMFWSNSNEEDI